MFSFISKRLKPSSWHILFTILLFTVCTQVNAQTFTEGVKYRIVYGKYNTGGIGIGACHNKSYIVCYVKDDIDLTDDCFWYIDKMGKGKWRFRNAKTNQVLRFTTAKDYETYVRVKLADVDDKDDKQTWTEGNAGGYFNFSYSNAEGDAIINYYLRKSHDASMIEADHYEDEYSRFAIVDEFGNEVLAPGAPEGGHIKPSTVVTAYIDSLQINGRTMIWDKDQSIYYSVLPTEDDDITLTFKQKKAECNVQLIDNGIAVTNTSELQPRHKYSVNVVANGKTVASVPAYFTGLPILNIQHEGKIEADMDYVWGSMELTSPEDETVTMTAKFKTRGASAMQYKKKSLNMKLRQQPLVEGGEEIETDTVLLGLRSASSWILDAMAADRVNMRNRVCFDLWNDFSGLPYETQFGGRNGTVGRFVEVWLNGRYNGIYCLTDRINRKLLDLKKPDINPETGDVTIRGVMYKGNKWNYTSFYKSAFDKYLTEYGDTRSTVEFCKWELSEPEDYPSNEAWAPLLTLYGQFEGNLNTQEFRNKMSRMFYLNNVADIHLFIIALCLGDNGNKNVFYSVQNITKTDDRSKFVISPWDMDASLGGDFEGTYYAGNYENTSIDKMKITQEGNPFKALWENSQEYRILMASRWAAARNGALSADSVEAKLTRYAKLLTETGAWDREYSKWQNTGWYNNQLVPDVQEEVKQIAKWYREVRIPVINRYLSAYIPVDIDEVTIAPRNDGAVYDLSGREVTGPTLPAGIYIIDGKKVFRK